MRIVVDQAGVVVAILRGQRNRIATRLQHAGRDIDTQRTFVLASEIHVSQRRRSVQHDRYIMRERRDYALQRDFNARCADRSRIQVWYPKIWSTGVGETSAPKKFSPFVVRSAAK